MAVHDGASKMLGQIEAGGHRLLAITRTQIAKVLDALDAGEFTEALASLSEAQASVAPLAQAQAYIAVASGATLMAARDVQPGMRLTGLGEITSVEVEECEDVVGCPGHVKIMLGEREFSVGGGQEIYVEDEDANEETGVDA